MRLKKILFVVMLGIVLFICVNFFGVLLDPVLAQNSGYNVYKYESEQKNSLDVLVFGSSFAYCSYSPMDAFDKYGVTSYLVAAPEQTIDKTYEYVLKALETQNPKIIFLETKGLSFEILEEKQEQAFIENRNIYYNLKTAVSGARVYGDLPFYNFFSYHSRWKELKKENYVATVKYFGQNYDTDITKGFVLLKDNNVVIEPYYEEVAPLIKSFPKNMSYVDKIYDICEQKKIKLVFLFTPSVNINYYNNYEKELKKLYPNIDLIKFNDIASKIGFDYYNDMYDWGHPNYNGALKITKYLSKYALSAGAVDKSNDENFAVWKEDYKKFEKEYIKISNMTK